MTSPSPSPSPDPAARQIVVAAESTVVQRVLSSVLTRAGYSVVAVGDGVAAAQAALSGPAAALVAWAVLPRLSGFAVTRLLRDDVRTKELPILLLTAPGAAAERFWAERCGASQAFPTDVEAHELVAAVGADVATKPGHAAGLPSPPRLRDSDDVVLERAGAVLERALFETDLAAEIAGLAVSGMTAQAVVAALLDIAARVADPSLVALVTAEPPAALVSILEPLSRGHYRDALVRAAAACADSAGVAVQAGKLDARAADPNGLLGSDEDAELGAFYSVALRGPDGAYAGHLVVSSTQRKPFAASVRQTLDMLAIPAGWLVTTVSGPRP
jgi:CheY-like chemotaxis protein